MSTHPKAEVYVKGVSILDVTLASVFDCKNDQKPKLATTWVISANRVLSASGWEPLKYVKRNSVAVIFFWVINCLQGFLRAQKRAKKGLKYKDRTLQ